MDSNNLESILIQVVYCCRQALSHFLIQCWPSFLSPYHVTRPKWIKGKSHKRYGVYNHHQQHCYIKKFVEGNNSDKRNENSVSLSLYEENPSVTGGFPAQRASNVDIVSTPYCHHGVQLVLRPQPQIVSMLLSLSYSISCYHQLLGLQNRLGLKQYSETCL